jgi:predicted aspartyl protease
MSAALGAAFSLLALGVLRLGDPSAADEPQPAQRITVDVATSGYVTLPVTINGRGPFPFHLATGSTYTILDAALAQELELELERGPGEELPQFVGRVRCQGSARLKSISVGKVGLERLVVQVADLKLPGARGLLGFDFVRTMVLAVDYWQQEVRFYSPDEYWLTDAPCADYPERAALDLEREQRAPIVRCLLDGKVSAKFVVDTGLSSFSLIGSRAAQALGGPARDTFGQPLDGLFGRYDVILGRARSLELGSLRIDRPVFAVLSDGPSPKDNAYTAAHGVLGTEILRRYRVTFDWNRERIVLEKPWRSETLESGVQYVSPGILFAGRPSEPLVARSFFAGSPAPAAGVELGDELVAIDGRNASALLPGAIPDSYGQ